MVNDYLMLLRAYYRGLIKKKSTVFIYIKIVITLF
ncbi:hypothetical protein OIU79_025523 [Salix purpurea]|uniref:Uncharacterized protein n=1 Tax=Salix purpurea TaxID=77065 RepID=A0A9Q1A733_SALPP|nr:hypothetical protein OIU79_025523 [Salix purpurea]